jgi:hypothetical protein
MAADTETAPPSMDSLSEDALAVIASFCENRALVASFGLASKAMWSGANVAAAQRARDTWSTSAEMARRGVRLGTAFLARRLRPPLTNADGSRVPLASRPLDHSPEELSLRASHKKEVKTVETSVRAHNWGEWWLTGDAEMKDDFEPVPTGRLSGRVLLVDVIVRNVDGKVVGRRSVLLDGADPLPTEPLRFEPLRVAEDLEPSTFYSNGHDLRQDSAWLDEVRNVVGGYVTCSAESRGRPGIFGFDSVNYEWPEQLMEHGLIYEYRPSQLPENRRRVSVRVDLFRLSDGKSMCLGEHDVGVGVHWSWPETFSEPPEDSIFLRSETLDDERKSLIPPDSVGCYDLFGCGCSVLADWPSSVRGPLDLYARGDLDLTAVKLRFECQSEPLLGRFEDLIDDNGGLWHSGNFYGPHVGAKAVRSLLALDAWA